MNISAEKAMAALAAYASDNDSVNLGRFFKTDVGQYGEGDVFIGVRVPQTRQVATEFKNLPLEEIAQLIDSPIHENRMCGLIILTIQFPKSGEQEKIYNLYLAKLREGKINNWDLVDVTCPRIIGTWLLEKDRGILYELARSENLWERRTAMVSTAWFIKNYDLSTTVDLAKILLHDKHDLIHKAVGWMLREAGKRDQSVLTSFLDKYSATMPRTALRYAIEKLPEIMRQHYLKIPREKS